MFWVLSGCHYEKCYLLNLLPAPGFLDLPTVLLCTSSTYTLHHSPLSLFSEILFHPLTELRLGTWTKPVIEFDL